MGSVVDTSQEVTQQFHYHLHHLTVTYINRDEVDGLIFLAFPLNSQA